jgi:transcriptional regulator with GAF, ATPase, and Fis domain
MENFGADLKQGIALACRSEAAVFITGETGSGKSTLAERIHRSGTRSARPFVTVNLASLHEATIEATLFGHERGAFTGADRNRIGRFELADGGTLFLDEIAELSLPLQARLL